MSEQKPNETSPEVQVHPRALPLVIWLKITSYLKSLFTMTKPCPCGETMTYSLDWVEGYWTCQKCDRVETDE